MVCCTVAPSLGIDGHCRKGVGASGPCCSVVGPFLDGTAHSFPHWQHGGCPRGAELESIKLSAPSSSTLCVFLFSTFLVHLPCNTHPGCTEHCCWCTVTSEFIPLLFLLPQLPQHTVLTSLVNHFLRQTPDWNSAHWMRLFKASWLPGFTSSTIQGLRHRCRRYGHGRTTFFRGIVMCRHTPSRSIVLMNLAAVLRDSH